jgi:hypothetical protein
MSKKQFEHIENKFREAAENYQPSLNQEAWEKMELLLDKDLNRKPRTAGFWITSLLLLLIGTGLGIYLVGSYQPDKQDTRITKPAISSNKIGNSTGGKKDQPASANETVPGSIGNEKSSSTLKEKQQSPRVSTGTSEAASVNAKQVSSAKTVSAVNNDKITKASKESQKKQPRIASRDNSTKKRGSSAVVPKATGQNNLTEGTTHLSEKNNSQNAEVSKTGVADNSQQLTDAVQQPKASAPAVSDSKPVKEQDIAQPLISKAQAESKKEQTAAAPSTSELPKSIESRLYFTASVASDANAIRGSGTGKVTAMYGIGLGYQVNKRFGIQTGIYAGSKRYSTDGANGYYLKPPYWPTVKIRNIDADCYIFNVPISVRYNAVTRRRGQWYAIAGISSYFMQKESYDYYYYYVGSSTLQHKKEVYGDNNHLFSVVDLSIGYEHRLSKHLSILGEPYIKVPLKGVGEGRVHLYSAGLMLGLKFRP